MTDPGAATPAPRDAGLEIAPEPFDAPAGTALVAELMADLERRYAADGSGDGDDPAVAAHHRVRPEQVVPPVGLFLVARLGGEPVGCGAVRRLLGGPADIAEIKRMYTAPAARRRGVSRALLARLEAEAAALGYRRLHLETGQRQPEAIRLYETAGFGPIVPFGQYLDDELSVCLGKDLTSGA
jgi:GNAT superfamily N-acetyltransferase